MAEALLSNNKRALALDRLAAFKHVFFGLMMPLFPSAHAGTVRFLRSLVDRIYSCGLTKPYAGPLPFPE